MELITEIYEKNIGIMEKSFDKSYNVRKASRAVIFNNSNQIALPFVSLNNYHKLPGGGIEEGENIVDALRREAIEEVGVEIDIIAEVGVIIEYRDNFDLLQISYCFVAKVSKLLDNTSFTDDELSTGFQLNWVDFDEAIQLVKNDKPDNYVGKFIQNRDLLFLLKSKEVIESLII